MFKVTGYRTPATAKPKTIHKTMIKKNTTVRHNITVSILHFNILIVICKQTRNSTENFPDSTYCTLQTKKGQGKGMLYILLSILVYTGCPTKNEN